MALFPNFRTISPICSLANIYPYWWECERPTFAWLVKKKRAREKAKWMSAQSNYISLKLRSKGVSTAHIHIRWFVFAALNFPDAINCVFCNITDTRSEKIKLFLRIDEGNNVQLICVPLKTTTSAATLKETWIVGWNRFMMVQNGTKQ